MNIETISHKVAEAVESGLFAKKKSLPSWLFYDEQGDKIFQEIMAMPEYYLTSSEYQILETFKNDILSRFSQQGNFRIVELGAGDGLKTEILLKHFLNAGADFSYHPIDISSNVIAQLEHRLNKSVPTLKIEPHVGEYLEALGSLKQTDARNIIFFLGSNIGNFTTQQAKKFLSEVSATMQADDLLFIGIDLKKSPDIIKNAYDDLHGITARFNTNLLIRLNRELGANFEPKNFKHYASYNPQTGEAKSFLISLASQQVYFPAFDKTLSFAQWESIHTEVSVKYDEDMIDSLARETGFKIEDRYIDQKKYFTDLIFRKI
jgi:L-histidine Nalpha-methyltransferase